MKMKTNAIHAALVCALALICATTAMAADIPNILFIFADNLGSGEIGCYGGGLTRGAATPRIDSLAKQGTRLLNMNMETQCTPSRSSLMTGTPFFACVSLTQPHLPTLPNPAFAGKTGNGDWADMLTEMDANVGQVLDAVDKAGVGDNTIVIFTSDNGAEFLKPWDCGSGPWRGQYCTELEGASAYRS